VDSDPCKLDEEGKKEAIHGHREKKIGRFGRRVESKDQSREEKRALATLWFEEELGNKLILGIRSC
jgi:hypothetical protein